MVVPVVVFTKRDSKRADIYHTIKFDAGYGDIVRLLKFEVAGN